MKKNWVLCEGKLTKNECWIALYFHGKSPGIDGLFKEFYSCFFHEIHDYFLESLNYSFIHQQLSHSQHKAMITLIEKKGKDKRFLKNWSLLLQFKVMKKYNNNVHFKGIRFI